MLSNLDSDPLTRHPIETILPFPSSLYPVAMIFVLFSSLSSSIARVQLRTPTPVHEKSLLPLGPVPASSTIFIYTNNVTP